MAVARSRLVAIADELKTAGPGEAVALRAERAELAQKVMETKAALAEAEGAQR